jgi:hypothetical protein
MLAIKRGSIIMARRATRSAPHPLRYAHPFFTATPPDRRPLVPALKARRMSDFIHAKMGPIPAPKRAPVMELAEILGKPGADGIASAGQIGFHAVGDTGRPSGDSKGQEDTAQAMTADYKAGADDQNPAFFLHLGDVIYGHRKSELYRDEFYRPYMKYPGKILAIAGNHDGETFAQTDPQPLAAFLANFCAPSAVVPPTAAAVRIFRQTMTQPGVYWLLNAPFVHVIGLYSNIAEGPGDLLGANGDSKQVTWLKKTLADLKTAKDAGDERALVIATHHPPFSEGGHGSSTGMLKQIDDACSAAGIAPHAMLAGHSHNYQRYTRSTTVGGTTAQVPYIVAGCGGHLDSSVVAAARQRVGDAVFEKSMKGYGYLLVTASKKQLTIEMFETTDANKRSFDKVSVDIASHRVV